MGNLDGVGEPKKEYAPGEQTEMRLKPHKPTVEEQRTSAVVLKVIKEQRHDSDTLTRTSSVGDVVAPDDEALDARSLSTTSRVSTPNAGSDVSDWGYASVSPAELVDVTIGLRPSQAVKFEELALKLHVEDYKATLSEESLREFEAKGEEGQLGAVRDWMTDPKRMEDNKKPRLEMRQCFGSKGLIANVALCCKDGATRDKLLAEFKRPGVADGLKLVAAGRTTIEISSNHVDKSSPIRYLQHRDNFQQALSRIGYKPGPTIDARRTQTVIVSDADGTLWEAPKAGLPVEASNLYNSKARGPILSYLAQGGVLVFNTGNDPARTVRRLLPGLDGLPASLKEEILSRIIIVSGGGGSMAGFVDGKPEEFDDYHSFDPETPTQPGKLDMLYLGDDPKMAGNDMPAFIATEGHYICVAPESKKEHVEESGITEQVQYGEVESSHSIFSSIVMQAMTDRAALKEGKPLFSDMAALMANTRNVGDAREITEKTLERLGGREGVDEVISRDIDQENPPMRVSAEDTVATMAALPKPREGEENTFANVLLRVSRMSRDSAPTSVSRELDMSRVSDEAPLGSPESAVNAFLDGSDMVDRSKSEKVTLRILEPGNNDQATPIHVAAQIKHLKDEVKRRGGDPDNVNIQVIVLGKGGHATTATFPQIGQMQAGAEGKIFTGTEEAVSLGGTLQRALLERGIPCDFVKTLDGSEDVAGGVSIRLEKESTNTGENVKNTVASYREKRPDYQWVVAATPSSRRQLLTFAHQYEDGGEKCYDELWGMPMQRSAKFVSEGLSDYQAVTEYYAGMAEKARLISYAIGGNPFIPIYSSDPKEVEKTLNSLYENYAKLEGVDVEEAKRTMTVNQLQGYFGAKFSSLEQAIPWSKEVATQGQYTDAAIKEMMQRQKGGEIRKAFATLGKYAERGVADEDLASSLVQLRAFLVSAGKTRADKGDNLYTLCRRVNQFSQRARIV